MTTQRVVRVSYSGPEDTYIIPKDLPLLSKEDNDKVWATATGTCVPFSWWIKWRTFYYYDKDGNKQTLEMETEGEVDYKHSMGVEDEEEEGDE